MQNPSETKFQSAKAHAHFEGLWPYCDHGECRKRNRCTGGPRGTLRKNGGVPLCQRAASQARERKIVHERRKEFGHEPDKTDGEPEWFTQAMAKLGPQPEQ